MQKLLLLSELSKTFDENLKKRFANAYKFSNNVISKFILLLRPIDSIETYVSEMSKALVRKEEEIKCNNIEKPNKKD